MDEMRHFILHHNGEIDADKLRKMIAHLDEKYIDADIFDLRRYPTAQGQTGNLTLDLVLASIISLRHVPNSWVRHRRAIAVLSPKAAPQMDAAIAQFRSSGILCVVVVESANEVESARAMGTQLLDAPVLVLD